MKIKTEELEQLNNLNTKTLELINELGNISYNEIILSNSKNKCLDKIKEINSEENTLREYLVSIYGNININPQTGEYIKNENI